MSIEPSLLKESLFKLLAERGPGKSICPSEVARAINGDNEKEWRVLMKPIRTLAVDLANTGHVRLLRKGRVIDPNDFKGIYRITLPNDDENQMSVSSQSGEKT